MNTQELSLKTCLAVFAALVLLLLANIALSRVPMGGLNLVATLFIAGVQTFLVVIVFMHVRYSHRLIWIFAGIGFYWMIILLALSMADFLSRSWPPIGR